MKKNKIFDIPCKDSPNHPNCGCIVGVHKLYSEIIIMKKYKVKIKLFVTKNKKFRANITEYGCEPYEVTIGGQGWLNGKGRLHEKRILTKCESLVNCLQFELENL